ncbi:MAG: type II secretion system F family protein [Candidatus Sericytochromatia bacterium]
MSFTNIIITLAITAIVFVSVFLLIAVFSSNIEKNIDPVLGRYLKYLEKEFKYIDDIKMSPKRFMMMHIGITLILFGLGIIIMDGVFPKIFTAIILAIIGLFGGNVFVKKAKERRKNKFDSQFVDAIALIANAVRSGLSLMQAMELVVTEMPNPVAYELNLVIQSTRVGIPLDIALTEMSKRVHSEDLNIFITAVLIQSQTGGNLTEILETLGLTIRERFKLQRRIKALTAQGIASAYILTFLPVVLGVALFFVQPQTMKLLFTTNYGLMLNLLVIVMISIGSFFVRKIITIDI